MSPQEISQQFLKIYGGTEPPRCFFAPGRVNLIGEHTDYNNGFVLPCALSFGTYLAIRPTNDDLLHFASLNFPFTASIPAEGPFSKTGGEWINYPVGVIEIFRRNGKAIGGYQLLFAGDIPPAAGLSSSASIEMVTAFAMNALNFWKLDTLDLIHLSRRAENEYVGVSCGIMDQFAVGKGKEGAAIFLNCGTLNYNHVPVSLPGYRLVIINTNKKRGLADSKYNERVEECRQAVDSLAKLTGFTSLSDYNVEDFTRYSHAIGDETILRRARHVITENRRVLETVKALWNGDLEAFGKLLNESHESLKDDYEVTGAELDALVYAAREHPGTLCSRMTGAGFGGCTVSFVKTDQVESFIAATQAKYTERTGLTPQFYLPEIGEGVRESEL
jgi:galactokinase